MNYRRLGKTNLMVSEIGFGAEWLENRSYEDCKELLDKAYEEGINILDCWMAEPNVRTNIGTAIKEHRDKWYIQGHFGSTWQNGQYTRDRNVDIVKKNFEDLLTRLQTDYIDIGMIHFIDHEEEYERVMNGPFLEYVMEMKEKGVIKHIGLSTHNPLIGIKAVQTGFIEMILFSINPAYDTAPPTEDYNFMFDTKFSGYQDKIEEKRVLLYGLCEKEDVGITVMKPYAGGRLLNEKLSPFGVALTPVHCIHYCLTRPAVASVLCGYGQPEHIDDAIKYETATDDEKDYASVLANAPKYSYKNQCTYCGHCKPCPVNIDIASINKYYDLATIHDEIPATVKEHYMALEAHGSDCIACKACEERCPFNVKVAERMKLAADIFGK